jgi:muramoyltetrapeptide carboxypeptidase
LRRHGHSGEELIRGDIRKPAALRPGGTVGVVAPAGPVDEGALARGVATLERHGFRVRLGEAVLERAHYLAGADARRASDLNAMIAARDVDAIVCARGGYGSGRLLPLVDVGPLRHRPKPLVGHSDLTFLLTHVVQRAGVVAFHGPMLSWFAQAEESTAALLSLLGGEPLPPIESGEIWRPGRAEGVLAGGCLSIVAAMIGTPYELDTRGRILFLEDVNEKPYRVDRMLTQLRQAGALDEVAALVIGELPNCFDGEEVTPAEVVLDVCRGDYPIVAGVPSGHGRGLLTLPLGVRARLAGATLEVVEAAVAA